MKKYLLLISAIAINYSLGHAQAFYPHINFEVGQTTPSDKSYASLDTINTNGIKWIMPGVRLGMADANDYKIDSRSARIGRVNETLGEHGCMTMTEDLFNGLHDFTFKAAMYGNHTGGQLEFAYSTNSGSTWVLADTFNIPANPNPAVFNAHYHINGRVRFRLCKVDAGNGIINVDSISIEELAPPPATFDITSKTPMHNSTVSVLTNKLTINFNQFVNRNAGVLTLGKVGGASQTFDVVTNPNVEIQGGTININNLTLEPNSTYYVTIPNGYVTADYGATPNSAIDSGNWMFYTSRSHFDSFTAANGMCNTIDTFDGVFKMVSISGLDRWSCESENGKGLYRMKVNPSGNNYPANEDWLVTAFPVLTTPNAVLTFEEAKEGFGTNTQRQLFYTTRFNGQINNTTWQVLNALDFINAENTYIPRSIPLGNRGLPDTIYIAFKYTSDLSTNNLPYTWKLSNIKYNSNALSVHQNNIYKNKIGQISTSRQDLKLYMQSSKNETYNFQIVDIQGRVLNQFTRDLIEGNNIIDIDGTLLNTGIYMVLMRNSDNFETVKILVTE